MAGISESLNKNICRNCHFFIIRQHVTKDYASKNLAYVFKLGYKKVENISLFFIGIRNPYDTFGSRMYVSSTDSLESTFKLVVNRKQKPAEHIASAQNMHIIRKIAL